MSLIRLDNFIATACGLSRKDAKGLIRAGRITVSGRTALSVEEKIDPAAPVRLDGTPLDYRPHVILMMHKPAGILTASQDTRRTTVLDLLPDRYRRRKIAPAGRLDLDTTGLLILTDDGPFAHRMLSPRSHVPKTYLVRLDAPVDQTLIAAFAAGTSLPDGTPCRPARLRILDHSPDTGQPLVELVICEGKYHQVKRMFGAHGIGVTALHRAAIGSLALDPDLPPGGVRELSDAESILLLQPEPPFLTQWPE